MKVHYLCGYFSFHYPWQARHQSMIFWKDQIGLLQISPHSNFGLFLGGWKESSFLSFCWELCRRKRMIYWWPASSREEDLKTIGRIIRLARWESIYPHLLQILEDSSHQRRNYIQHEGCLGWQEWYCWRCWNSDHLASFGLMGWGYRKYYQSDSWSESQLLSSCILVLQPRLLIAREGNELRSLLDL